MVAARILIVEDEILIARKIESTLRQLGHEVIGIAQDAAMALQKAAETQPELVLMDIVIQGEVDGIAAAEQIRDRLQIPVVYLTAYADEGTFERAMQTQPFGYLLKPFNQNELRIAVELALFRHQTELDLKARGVNSEAFQQKVQMASQLLLMLSHDLRNPLTAIKFSASALESYSTEMDTEMKQRYLHRIQSAANSMNRLLENVLTLGVAVSDQEQFAPVDRDVVQLCRDLVEAAPLSAEGQPTQRFVCQATSLIAYVDEQLLWHLLSNLLSNAVKYSPRHSLVTLTLLYDEAELCFEVQDEGIGMLPEDQKRLFEPFQRGSNVGQLPGTGLGLTIAKRVVDLHSGHIEAKSQVGQGTTITVRLPRLQQQHTRLPVPPNPPDKAVDN
ncbi:MAG TPA: ATP-binding protein [Crinalium sp.]